MAEELAFKKTLADPRAIDRDKRLVGALTLGKKPPGNQLLPRAAFPFDQHGTFGGRHLIHKLQHITNRIRNAHNYGHTGSRNLKRIHDMLGGHLS